MILPPVSPVFYTEEIVRIALKLKINIDWLGRLTSNDYIAGNGSFLIAYIACDTIWVNHQKLFKAKVGPSPPQQKKNWNKGQNN